MSAVYEFNPEADREFEDERVRRSFYAFVKQAWHVVEPAQEYRDNWHVEVICRVLEAVSRGEIQRLVINIPPGHAKSLIVSVLWPAWVWLRKPGWRCLSTSYAQTLTLRDSTRCRQLVESAWYQRLIKWKLRADINRRDHFANDVAGERMALAFQSSTGFRGDCVIVDDPISAMDAQSETERETCITTWKTAYPTRVNDPKTGAWVIIMQRLHEVDLTGFVLERGGYEHLMLPAEYNPERHSVVRYQRGPRAGQVCVEDPRKNKGELIFPDLFSAEDVATLREQLGPDAASAQLDQDPVPKDGQLFRRSWWRFYTPDGLPSSAAVPRPEGCDKTAATVKPDTTKGVKLISVDASFLGEARSDYCVMTVWMRRRNKKFLIDMRRGKWDFVQLKEQFLKLCKDYPEAKVKLVEKAANGAALISMLSAVVSGMEGIMPEGGKIARANACQAEVFSGDVLLPEGAPWLEDFVGEFAKFPKGKNDDIVDSTTQALVWLADSPDAARLRALGTI